jgi:integrase
MKHDNENSNGSKKSSYELVGEMVRIFQRGGRWYANFQHNGRQQRTSLKTNSKKEARRRAIQLEADLLSGSYAAAAKAPGLDKVIDDYRSYLQGRRRGDKTLTKYEYAFQQFLDLAKRRRVKSIEQVDLSFVDAFRKQRRRHGSKKLASAKTVHNDLVLLRQVVNFALRRKMIQSDPLAGLQLEKPKPRPQPCWTRDEVDRILKAAREPQRGQLTLLAETGMRVGELRWLTWEDVDLQLGVIHIRPKPDGCWKPKTGDIRAIPISPDARRVLERLPRHCQWVVTARASRPYPQGDHPISERRLLDYLKRLLKHLGLRGHLHTFRHAFISHALTQGIPEAIVRQWVGHVDRDIIRQYTHIADRASQAAMQRLARGTDSNLQKTDLGGSNHVQVPDADSAQNQHSRSEGQSNLGAK